MFLWNLEKCLQIFDKTYVSSDSDKILAMAEQFGAIPIKRPKELCGDVPNIPCYRHAMQFMDCDAFVAVQANSPTLEPKLIEMARDIMNRGFIDELVTCHLDKEIYGSIWAMTKRSLYDDRDIYPDPEVLIYDSSKDIHTKEDLQCAIHQSSYVASTELNISEEQLEVVRSNKATLKS